MKNEPLSFFEKEEIKITKKTVVKKGIANYCCKKMKKACEDFDTGEKERYDNKGHGMAKSIIYDKERNKIGMEVHSAYDYDSCGGGYDFFNYMEFKFCPFCGTEINGLVEIDDKDEK